MRRDDFYLNDILEAAQIVAEYLGGITPDSFLASSLLRDAVLLRLTNIGEACARLSEDLRAAHPDVPWQKVKAFRNLAVHAYFSVDWPVVWTLATERLPELARQVEQIIEVES